MNVKENKKNILRSKKEKITYNLTPREKYFDSSEIKILNDFHIDDGVLVIYSTKSPFCLGAALFDKETNELLYRTASPIFKSKKAITKLKIKMIYGELELSFNREKREEIEFISIDYILGKNTKKVKDKPIVVIKSIIEKHISNPILSPVSKNSWECAGTFNPAVICINNVVHILYRAVGGDGGSVIGYATSKDGLNIDERLPHPIYKPSGDFELRVNSISQPIFPYGSGARYDCWGGCEDPRITMIDDTLYMIYTAFNGVSPPCVAMTSIKVCDFLNRKWDSWRTPVLVSPKNKINKNWVIFPEKINGKFAIMHSITPNIQIELLDTLDLKENPNIKSTFVRMKNKDSWDSVIRGVGPTPLKIDEGWLIFYHAIDDREPGRYKIGAAILDYKNPTKMLYKSTFPIIEPDRKYENEGFKGGIVYSCGAVIKDENIIVYYGGADTVVCVASCNLKKFIKQIKENNGKIY